MKPSPRNCRVQCYGPSMKGEWDAFVGIAKNGSFLFFRDYMDYHCDRFVDHSLMFFLDGRLAACLPATAIGQTLHSHRGLTYGGLVLHPDIRQHETVSIVARLAAYLGENGFDGLSYNPMPYIYHRLPAEEDLEAFARLDGRIVAAKATFVLPAGRHRHLFSDNRRRDVARFRKSGLVLGRSYDFQTFMTLCASHLSRRFSAKPVHTAAEIQALASRFPKHIQLYAAHDHPQMVAGAIVYANLNCARIQYLAHDDLGGKSGALTAIIAHVVENILPPNTWLELGHSIGLDGQLNEGVNSYKESLGARTIQLRSYFLPADVAIQAS